MVDRPVIDGCKPMPSLRKSGSFFNVIDVPAHIVNINTNVNILANFFVVQQTTVALFRNPLHWSDRVTGHNILERGENSISSLRIKQQVTNFATIDLLASSIEMKVR